MKLYKETLDYNSYEDPQIAKKVELIEKQIKEIFEDAKSDLDIDEAYYELSGYLGELRHLYMFGDEE